MATIANIESRVRDRLEENGPLYFWNLQNEIRPFIVEALFAATLITGEPQFKQTTTFFTIPQGPTSPIAVTLYSVPSDCLSLSRVEAAQGLTIDKTFIWDLDRLYPNWETTTGPQAQYWYPFGLTQFGIYPSLTAPQEVQLTYIQTPVAVARPYTGAENLPLPLEYFEGLEDWAAAMARLKEGGQEFDEAQAVLQRAVDKFGALSRWVWRKNSLRFTRALGSQSRINEVSTK